MPRTACWSPAHAAERPDYRLHLTLRTQRSSARHHLAISAARDARQIRRTQRVKLGEPEALTEPLGGEQLLLGDRAALI